MWKVALTFGIQVPLSEWVVIRPTMSDAAFVIWMVANNTAYLHARAIVEVDADRILSGFRYEPEGIEKAKQELIKEGLVVAIP